MDPSHPRNIKEYGNYTFNKTQPKIEVSRAVTPGASGSSNSTKIDVTFTYTEAGSGSGKDSLKLKDAVLKLTIEWGAPLSVLHRP